MERLAVGLRPRASSARTLWQLLCHQQVVSNHEPVAWFRLTLTSIDKLGASYSRPERPGETFTPYDYPRLSILEIFASSRRVKAVQMALAVTARSMENGSHSRQSPPQTVFFRNRFLVGVKNRIPEHRPENSQAAEDDMTRCQTHHRVPLKTMPMLRTTDTGEIDGSLSNRNLLNLMEPTVGDVQ